MTDHPLQLLLGTWAIEARHPAMPDVLVRGTATGEWLEGEQFLIHRGRMDHDLFPDSISVIGVTATDRIEDDSPGDSSSDAESPMTMHYFDSRGVFRVYEVSLDAQAWRIWREAPGFSQRFTGTFTDGGNTIEGLWQMRPDDVTWEDDLQITYRRQPPAR